MRLYLDAESKNNVGYTPDWIQVTYDENGHHFQLTLDIQGSIDYDRNSLSCRCKGELVPWTLFIDHGDEIDLSEMSKEEVEEKYPDEKLFWIFAKGYNFLVGVYPVDDENYDDTDCLEEGNGSVEFNVSDETHSINFEFDVEINWEDE